MDSLIHASQKILLERAASGNQAPSIPDTAPPAYSATCPNSLSHDNNYSDSDSNVSDADNEDPSPVTLTLNAGTTVHGTGNLVATPALSDATRFSALLLAAVQKLNAIAEAAATGGEGDAKSRPILQVQLVVNCGIMVTGDRNVVGYRAPQTMSLPGGVKRKAVADGEEVPAAKRVEME